MRKQIGGKNQIKKSITELANGEVVLTEAVDTEKAGREIEGKMISRRADFVKYDEAGPEVHGFKKKIVIQKGNDIFAKPTKNKDVVLPLDILSYISLEFDVKDVKNVLCKKFGIIKDIRFEDNELYAKVDIIKSGEMPMAVLGEARRSLDEYLSEDNIPEDIKHIASTKKDPVRLLDGEPYVLLDTDVILTQTILKNLVHIEDYVLNGSKSEQRDAKNELVKELTSRFISEVKVTETRISKKKLYFALVINTNASDLAIEVNSAKIVAANMSMSHERFNTLSQVVLDEVRKGSKTKFVRTSDIINSKTHNLVYARSDMGMMRNPLIELVELKDSDVKELLTKDSNAKPLFIYKESEPDAYLSLFGQSKSKEIDQPVIKKLFGNLYTDEPVFFKDPVTAVDFLCPDIKRLAMFVLTGETELPIKVGVVSTAKDIAIAFEISL